MECSVEGCGGVSDGSPPGNQEYNLCPHHYNAWGYYRAAYYTALDKEDGYLRRGLWKKAMTEFLEHCGIEIAGLKVFAQIGRLRGGKPQ